MNTIVRDKDVFMPVLHNMFMNKKLKIFSLSIFTFSFIGLFMLSPGGILYYLCPIGLILSSWIDFYGSSKEEYKIDLMMEESNEHTD